MKANRLSTFLIALIFIITVVIPTTVWGANDESVSLENEEQKIYSQATFEENFADNRVMVVMKNDASLELNDYTVEDFLK